MKITPQHHVFCSYAYTGEDAAVVEARMQAVVNTFRELGITAYCNLYDEVVKGFTTPNQYILAARDALRKCDVLFVIQASERRSEGQLIEVGMALERDMPMVLAQHESATGRTYLDTLAGASFTWTNNDSLCNAIRSLV